ncbi:MAG: NAD(P)-dependent glycerol-3-phosphate dehydrogenase [Acidimicrobiia bacterium]|nr:NAD(P)-dependent glycerol-3-phosphate dehydrogenase [Acidimicrobiia bacterium]
MAVLGAGSWGTTLAGILAPRAPTMLWARRPDVADHIAATHRNPVYVRDLHLPPDLVATGDLAQAVSGADVVVMAVPSHGFRSVLAGARSHLQTGAAVLTVTKGVEQGTLKRMTEIVVDVAPGHPFAVLTGPNLAEEVGLGQPTASVVAARGADGAGNDAELAVRLQRLLSTATFRVYTNDDLVGCELGGSVKNVMAIASGISDGMGFGDNARATLITRGLAEMTRLGVALGGRPLTFAGLAGLGDLVATCMSGRSRNRWVGEQLGRGRTIDEITSDTPMVAEGVRSSLAVVELAERAGVETPIASEVVAVIHHGKRATDALTSLMARVIKAELHGFSPSGG